MRDVFLSIPGPAFHLDSGSDPTLFTSFGFPEKCVLKLILIHICIDVQ